MCYLVTKEIGDKVRGQSIVGLYEAKDAALTAAKEAAIDGAENVRLWGLMHSMAIRIEVDIQDHFKGNA